MKRFKYKYPSFNELSVYHSVFDKSCQNDTDKVSNNNFTCLTFVWFTLFLFDETTKVVRLGYFRSYRWNGRIQRFAMVRIQSR